MAAITSWSSQRIRHFAKCESIWEIVGRLVLESFDVDLRVSVGDCASFRMSRQMALDAVETLGC